MDNQLQKFWKHPYAKYIFGTAILIMVLALVFKPDFEFFRDSWVVKLFAMVFVAFALFFLIRMINKKE